MSAYNALASLRMPIIKTAKCDRVHSSTCFSNIILNAYKKHEFNLVAVSISDMPELCVRKICFNRRGNSSDAFLAQCKAHK